MATLATSNCEMQVMETIWFNSNSDEDFYFTCVRQHIVIYLFYTI